MVDSSSVRVRAYSEAYNICALQRKSEKIEDGKCKPEKRQQILAKLPCVSAK
jgi:hypothetical protein